MLRYSRQTVLPQLGAAGQQALLRGKVLLVGAGGLGLPCAQALVAGGLKQLDLIDDDRVSLSNLQRQTLFHENDIGQLKVEIAAARLRKINSSVLINPIPQRLSAEDALTMLCNYDLIIDGSDNFKTKFLVNDACLVLKKIWIYGSVSRFEGHISTFGFPEGACYRCLFPQVPKTNIENCAEQGVLGSVSSALGCLQALEAQKVLIGRTNFNLPNLSELKVYDFENDNLKVLQIPRRPNCVCGQPERIELQKYDSSPACDFKSQILEITWDEYIKYNFPKLLVDVRSQMEFEEFHPEGAIHLGSSGGELTKDKTLFFYCRSGQRSRQACLEFQRSGRRVFNIIGGLNDL